MKTQIRRITLDGARFTSREAAHAYIAQRLGFPKWYGANLDALYDALGDIASPVKLTLLRADAPERQLGHYGPMFIKVFGDAARANPNLCFVMRFTQRLG